MLTLRGNSPWQQQVAGDVLSLLALPGLCVSLTSCDLWANMRRLNPLIFEGFASRKNKASTARRNKHMRCAHTRQRAGGTSQV